MKIILLFCLVFALFLSSCTINQKRQGTLTYTTKQLRSIANETTSNVQQEGTYSDQTPMAGEYFFTPGLEVKDSSIKFDKTKIQEQRCKIWISEKAPDFKFFGYTITEATKKQVFASTVNKDLWAWSTPITAIEGRMSSSDFPDNPLKEHSWSYNPNTEQMIGYRPVADGRVMKMTLSIDPNLQYVYGVQFDLLSGQQGKEFDKMAVLATFTCKPAFM